MHTFILATLALCLGATNAIADTPRRSAHKPPAALEVTSSAFNNNQAIPSKYTCDGVQIAPPLSWSKAPAGTKSIAILVDDPDAPRGTFTHWLVTGIPPATTSIRGTLPEGAVEAKNDTGAIGYAGPCPPSGRHRYQFRVYALDIALRKAMTRSELLDAVRGHILATGQLVGTYERKTNR